MNLNLALGEALAKAGIKGTKTLHQIEKEIDRDLERSLNKSHKSSERPNKDVDLLTRLWQGERSKKFMLHVLHTFIPFNKAGFATGWTEDQEKKCCMCRHDLITKNDAITRAPDQVKEAIRSAVPILAAPWLEDFPKEMEFIAIGIFGSRTVFCPKCWTDFIKWVTTSVDPDIQKLRRKGEPNESKSKS